MIGKTLRENKGDTSGVRAHKKVKENALLQSFNFDLCFK